MNDLSGPVGVASTMAATAQVNIRAFLQLVAFFSINLGVMNLLPLPALDGGKVFFLVINTLALAIFKRQIPPKYENYIHMAGFALLMALMLFITFHDVMKLL